MAIVHLFLLIPIHFPWLLHWSDCRGASPLEFISFLDEEIDEQVPVAVTCTKRIEQMCEIGTSGSELPTQKNPLMLQRSSGRQYTSLSFIDSYTFSHCHIVLENAPWLCRSSEWPPWKWEVNRSKLQRRNRWGTAWSDVANTSLCRFAPPGHECYVPLHRAWMWRWCRWVHVPFRYTSTQKLDENISRNTTWNAEVKLPFLSKHRVCRYTYTYTLKFQSLQYKNIHTRWNIDHIAVIHLWIHKTFLLNMGNLMISDITTSTFSRVICLQDFFEGVLGKESCYWTAISRSHLVLTEVDPGSFLVQRLDQKKWQMLVENHSPHYFFGYFFNKSVFCSFLFFIVIHWGIWV